MLQPSSSHVQSKVHSHGEDEDSEDHNADDHSHQRAVVVAFIQRAYVCVWGGIWMVKKMALPGYVIESRFQMNDIINLGALP